MLKRLPWLYIPIRTMTGRDAASDQLLHLQITPGAVITTKSGAPVGVKTATQTVGKSGPAVLQDVNFLDEMSAFDRERIPERVVHAKGAGAFGYFEVTHDVTEFCAAKLFECVGMQTAIAMRFSTVGGESGSADTVRDPRGFAIKFYTVDGNWDLVGNNTPVFFIRDPILFPSFVHTQKRNPATHLKDANMFWDFITLRPETIHQVLYMFGDRGIPDGYRHMNGYGSHTFKVINANKKVRWVKFHCKTNQGVKNLTVEKANQLASSDPDYAIRDLYNAIANCDCPSWDFQIQVMTQEQATNSKFNPFDVTKVWPHVHYPLISVGKLTLTRNPLNYFSDIEQLAFSPANLVPGIEPSPDKMLQGRLFSYSDTQRHRLGANFLHIPVNCPINVHVSNFQRDGPQCMYSQGDAPNYFPNSFSCIRECQKARHLLPPYCARGYVDRFDSGCEDNFSQATVLYEKVFSEEEKKRVVKNIVESLRNALPFIQDRAVKVFSQVHRDLGSKIGNALSSMCERS